MIKKNDWLKINISRSEPKWSVIMNAIINILCVLRTYYFFGLVHACYWKKSVKRLEVKVFHSSSNCYIFLTLISLGTIKHVHLISCCFSNHIHLLKFIFQGWGTNIDRIVPWEVLENRSFAPQWSHQCICLLSWEIIWGSACRWNSFQEISAKFLCFVGAEAAACSSRKKLWSVSPCFQPVWLYSWRNDAIIGVILREVGGGHCYQEAFSF